MYPPLKTDTEKFLVGAVIDEFRTGYGCHAQPLVLAHLEETCFIHEDISLLLSEKIHEMRYLVNGHADDFVCTILECYDATEDCSRSDYFLFHTRSLFGE
jgi:hypothetical protein